MKKNCYFIFAALMFLMAACAQEELPVGGDESKTDISTENTDVIYINAVSEFTEDTKASIDDGDGDFKWSTGDKVAVYAAGGYVISEGLAADYNGMTSATFAFTGDQLFGQGDRANFAVFPASLVCDENGDVYTGDAVTESVLAINLPSVYNLSQVKDNNAPTPMIATNAPGEGLRFKSICALVRFTLHSIPKQTQYITFDFNGKKVRGEFALTAVVPGEEATRAETSAAEGFDDVITVYNDNVFTAFQNNLVVNIPIPAGEFSKVTITTWDGDPWDGGHKINGITSSIRTAVAEDGKSYLSWNAGRLSSGKREIFMPVYATSVSNGVGAGVKVVFAPGNLRAVIEGKPAANKPGYASSWHFAEHQYDAIGDYTPEGRSYSVNSLQAPEVGDVIDLFAQVGAGATGYVDTYADDKYKYGILYPSGSNLNSFTGTTNGENILLDWGHNEISDNLGTYPADTWRTLTATEWYKVVYNRGCTRLRGIIVNDDESPIAYGYILTPDQYTHPIEVKQFTNSTTGNGNITTPSSDNKFTLAEWDALESAGCVFLPLTNWRNKATTTTTISPGDGCYWFNHVATSSGNGAAFIFSDLDAGNSYYANTDSPRFEQGNKSFARKLGAAVRLVRQVN